MTSIQKKHAFYYLAQIPAGALVVLLLRAYPYSGNNDPGPLTIVVIFAFLQFLAAAAMTASIVYAQDRTKDGFATRFAKLAPLGTGLAVGAMMAIPGNPTLVVAVYCSYYVVAASLTSAVVKFQA